MSKEESKWKEFKEILENNYDENNQLYVFLYNRFMELDKEDYVKED